MLIPLPPICGLAALPTPGQPRSAFTLGAREAKASHHCRLWSPL
jgi:hypothetical protein